MNETQIRPRRDVEGPVDQDDIGSLMDPRVHAAAGDDSPWTSEPSHEQLGGETAPERMGTGVLSAVTAGVLVIVAVVAVAFGGVVVLGAAFVLALPVVMLVIWHASHPVERPGGYSGVGLAVTQVNTSVLGVTGVAMAIVLGVLAIAFGGVVLLGAVVVLGLPILGVTIWYMSQRDGHHWVRGRREVIHLDRVGDDVVHS
jgi:hypothetical protein